MAGALFVAKHLKRQKVQERRNKKDESYTPIWAAHVAGGTHHAFSDYGEGFSVFSDIAVAANVVLQRYPSVVKNILIVDLDVHQGNGNAVLFQQQEHVFTFSMHCSGNYFSEKQNSDLDIELPIGCNDSTYLMTLNHWLKQFQQQHESRKFDLIFFQAGVDPLSADRLGRMDLSSDGLRRRNELVYQFAYNLQVPLVICMGGGYPKQISKGDVGSKSDGWEEIIDAHANVYVQAYQFLDERSAKIEK
jgi:acetoin utilization deacetylase AcuC-like enzyme